MTDKSTSLPAEFELIATYLAPLSRGFPGAFDLTDDAALLTPTKGHELLVKADTIVAGVHFREDDPADLVARKALRVNLSDIASKGGRARAYMLALVLPKTTSANWISDFADGLAADQRRYGIHLIGGDTNATPGPLTIAVTAFGEVPTGRMLRRSGARVNDRIFVTGSLGDAILGLRFLEGSLPKLDSDAAAALVDRYRLPRPRVEVGPRLLDHANATIDISDGLIADLGHICDVSELNAVVRCSALPLSSAARVATALDPGLVEVILSGGDDYEILFTAPEDAQGAIDRVTQETGIPITEIGYMTSRKSSDRQIRVMDDTGRPIALTSTGWVHF